MPVSVLTCSECGRSVRVCHDPGGLDDRQWLCRGCVRELLAPTLAAVRSLAAAVRAACRGGLFDDRWLVDAVAEELAEATGISGWGPIVGRWARG
jgi:hypothetical protein